MNAHDTCPECFTNANTDFDRSLQPLEEGLFEHASNLIWKKLDNNISEEEVLELSVMLRDNKKLNELYLEYFKIHLDLILHYQT